MGSNPSKNEVVRIRIPSSKGKRDESDESSTSKLNKTTSQSEVDILKGELCALKAELKTQKEQNANSEDTSYSLQNQLDEREREILLLREELESLQRKTSRTTKSDMKKENSTDAEEKCDRTIYAKDQYIQTLEEDLKMMKELTAKQDEKYQRKLKKLRSVLSKSKQDSSLKLFELKDEKKKLAEENTKLQERIERMSLVSGDFGRQGSANSQRSELSHDKDSIQESPKDFIDNHDDPRMKLILELSEQVANLDSENLALKRELKHCRKVAERTEKLRIQKKQNQASERTEIIRVDKGNLSWKGLESNQSCIEIT